MDKTQELEARLRWLEGYLQSVKREATDINTEIEWLKDRMAVLRADIHKHRETPEMSSEKRTPEMY